MRRTKAEAHLIAVDPVMGALIERVGPCRLRRRRVSDPYEALVRSIVSQMISTKAARTVFARLQELLAEERPTPERVLTLGPQRLRKAGLSRTKARAVVELAARVDAGELPLDTMKRWRSERIKRELIATPGIGEWTANMFLIFHLCRPDVFPAKDLGILEGMRQTYRLRSRPKPPEARRRAEPWAPYRSTAAWYLWRSLDGAAQI